jgi:hypothetical protein
MPKAQRFSFSLQVFFGNDKYQEIPLGFVQYIAQDDMQFVKNISRPHHPPACKVPPATSSLAFDKGMGDNLTK